MRCLGIDYGTRRIGLSYGDELGVATPLPALTEVDAANRWSALLDVARGSGTRVVVNDRFDVAVAAAGMAVSEVKGVVARTLRVTLRPGAARELAVAGPDGRPSQLTPFDEGFIDFLGRPWAQNWEKFFEQGWERPPLPTEQGQ